MVNAEKKFFSIILFLVFIFIRLPGETGNTRRAFTISDGYRIKGISGLSLSPDGAKLLFSVTAYGLDKGEKNSDIYLLDLISGRQNRLTFNTAADYDPFWSSDGHTIYFLSDREDGVQIWELNAAGGEARKISAFSAGISDPRISAGGDKIFFTSAVFPECMTDDSCNRKLSERLEKGPVQAYLADSLLYRHWNSYREWRTTHLFYFDLTDGKIRAVTGGKSDYPPVVEGALGAGCGFCVSPDGKEVCVTGNVDSMLATSTNSDLFLIGLNSKEAVTRNITEKNLAYDGSPLYSPDGKYIAFLRHKIPGYEADRFRLAVFDRQSGRIEILTEKLDNQVQDFCWAPDSSSIYFSIADKGRSPVYRIRLKTGRLERVLDNCSIREFSVTPDGKFLMMLKSAVAEPAEIWSYRIGSNKYPKRLTFFHRQLEQQVDFRPAETHWVTGAEGKQVQLFVVKPHGFVPQKKYPLVINIHGGPQMMWSDSFRLDWQVYPGSGYVVAFPNPHGSTGYGQDFTAAISSDWNGKVMEDINRVTDYLEGLEYIDRDRMGVMGWSWGGYAVMWLEGNSNRYRALVSMMGVYDLAAMYSSTEELWFPEWDMGGTPWDKPEVYRDQSPKSYVKNFKTPCLVITGERDYRIPYTQSLEFFTDLQKMAVPSRLIIFKNDGHWPDHVKSMPVYYNAHLEWFHTYLGGEPAPYDTEKLIKNRQFTRDQQVNKGS
jgi:dipeptidyl aminopeptidase/acylaminoacyl peptidase